MLQQLNNNLDDPSLMPSDPDIDQIIEWVIETAAAGNDDHSNLPTDISKLIDCKFDQTIASDLFETLVRYYNKLINQLVLNDFKLINGKLRLCYHDSNSETHSCAISILVDIFETRKKSIVKSSFDRNKLNDFFVFLNGLRCISQISKLVDLFDISSFNSSDLLSFIESELIDYQLYCHAILVIDSLNIRHIDIANELLIILLFQDNFSTIERFLRLSNIQIQPSLLSTKDNQQNEFFIIKFLQILDKISVNLDEFDRFKLVELKEIKIKHSKIICNKIYSYVLELFRKPTFEDVNDFELALICPKIIAKYFDKQLRNLLFQLRKQLPSVAVICDHIDSLLKTGRADLIQKAHHEILRLFEQKHDSNSANSYSKVYKLKSQFKNNNQINRSNCNSADTSKYLYPFKLSLNKGIVIVDSADEFVKCINEIKKWNFVGLDSEWCHNYFVVRQSKRISLIQIAHNEKCYLIDCEALSKQNLLQHCMEQFVENVIENDDIIKIGYSIIHDFRVFENTLNDLRKGCVERCLLDADRIKHLDFVDLFTFLTDPANGYANLFNNVRLEIATSKLSGLSQVTFLFMGHSIDKSEQVSDWSKRPLRNSQILYAALDAHCLVDCYNQLTVDLLKRDQMPIDRFIREVFNDWNSKSNKTTTKKLQLPTLTTTTIQEEGIDRKPELSIREFRCVVDNMLFGIVRYLRICGADVPKLSPETDRDELVKLALKENRVFITSGHCYQQYRKFFPTSHDCIQLGNNLTGLEQFKELVDKCRLKIDLEYLFTRCSLCNTTPFTIISTDEFQIYYDKFLLAKQQLITDNDNNNCDETKKKVSTAKKITLESNNSQIEIDFDQFEKIKFRHRYPSVDKYYICPNCGHIFWDGSHSSNFIQSIKSLIVN